MEHEAVGQTGKSMKWRCACGVCFRTNTVLWLRLFYFSFTVASTSSLVLAVSVILGELLLVSRRNVNKLARIVHMQGPPHITSRSNPDRSIPHVFCSLSCRSAGVK